MTAHLNQQTGELLEADDIVERARELDIEIVAQDERIRDATATLKALKEGRDELVAELRRVIRPVPLFDGPQEGEKWSRTPEQAGMPLLPPRG